jgi:hypothetical protein
LINSMARTLQVASRSSKKSPGVKVAPTLEQIQVRAYEIFLERHGAPGNEVEDWLRAERELLEGPGKPPRSTRSPKSKAA